MPTADKLARLECELELVSSLFSGLEIFAQETIDLDEKKVLSHLGRGVQEILRVNDAVTSKTPWREEIVRERAAKMTDAFAELTQSTQRGLENISGMNRECHDLDSQAVTLRTELQALSETIQNEISITRTTMKGKQAQMNTAKALRLQRANELQEAENKMAGAEDDRNALRVIRGVVYGVGLVFHPLLFAAPFLEIGASELRDKVGSIKSEISVMNNRIASTAAEVTKLEKELETLKKEVSTAEELSRKHKGLEVQSASLKKITLEKTIEFQDLRNAVDQLNAWAGKVHNTAGTISFVAEDKGNKELVMKMTEGLAKCLLGSGHAKAKKICAPLQRLLTE